MVLYRKLLKKKENNNPTAVPNNNNNDVNSANNIEITTAKEMENAVIERISEVFAKIPIRIKLELIIN